MEKRRSKGKFTNFINGKGFYIILILCVAAVGISGYVLFFADRNETDLADLAQMYTDESMTPVITSQQPVITSIPEAAIRDTQVVMAEDILPKESDNDKSASSDLGSDSDSVSSLPRNPGDILSHIKEPLIGEILNVNADASIPADSQEEINNTNIMPTALYYVWPLSGEVIQRFSADELVFNDTTDDWRVHTGLDIAAQTGTVVSSIGDGYIEDVYEDEMMGWSIVVNHGNGVRSISRGLSDEISVAMNDRVKAGQAIGKVGSSSELEAAQPSHLHLEVISSGAQIDPLPLLP